MDEPMIVSGLKWLKFETGDPQPTGYSPLGLKWKERGSEKPAVGQEIKNKALAAELRQRLKFTRKEWDEFGGVISVWRQLHPIRQQVL